MFYYYELSATVNRRHSIVITSSYFIHSQIILSEMQVALFYYLHKLVVAYLALCLKQPLITCRHVNWTQRMTAMQLSRTGWWSNSQKNRGLYS
eukprot:scaffold157502_cov44-Prasinocladus_malaysianus.AAC.1